MLTTQSPIYVAGGAAYPYSKALEDLATVETRYGEVYCVARWDVYRQILWLPRGACPVSDDDRRTDGAVVPYEYRFTPRNEEQARIARDGGQALLAGASFIVQAPTGWGKTIVGCAMAAQVKRKTLVITTKDDILQQWIDAAKAVLCLSDAQIGVWRGEDTPSPTRCSWWGWCSLWPRAWTGTRTSTMAASGW